MTPLLVALLVGASPVVDTQTGLRFKTDHDGFRPCVLFPRELWDPDCGEQPPENAPDPRARLLFRAVFQAEDHGVIVTAAAIRMDRPSRMSADNVNGFIRGSLTSLKEELRPDLEVVPRSDGASFERRNLNQTVVVRWVVEPPTHDLRLVNYAFPGADSILTLLFYVTGGPTEFASQERIEKAMIGSLRPPVSTNPDFALPRNDSFELGRAVGKIVGNLCCLAAGIAFVIFMFRTIRKSGKAPTPGGAPPPPPPPPSSV